MRGGRGSSGFWLRGSSFTLVGCFLVGFRRAAVILGAGIHLFLKISPWWKCLELQALRLFWIIGIDLFHFVMDISRMGWSDFLGCVWE